MNNESEYKVDPCSVLNMAVRKEFTELFHEKDDIEIIGPTGSHDSDDYMMFASITRSVWVSVPVNLDTDSKTVVIESARSAGKAMYEMTR